MRYSLLLVFCALLGFQAYGQKIKNKYPVYLIKAQGGYVIDNSSQQSYRGAHLFRGGWATHQNRILQGLDLEFISYNRANNRDSFEFGYYRSYGMIGDINHGLFLGGFASVGYFEHLYTDSKLTLYTYKEECYCFNIGPKLDYVYMLNRWLFVIASSRVSLIEFGNYERKNPVSYFAPLPPTTKEFDTQVIKHQFQLMLGFGIKL